jgi:hypothetical protein
VPVLRVVDQRQAVLDHVHRPRGVAGLDLRERVVGQADRTHEALVPDDENPLQESWGAMAELAPS